MTEYWIVGESHRNLDGRSRQQLIKKHCKPGALVSLVREPDNPADPQAVAVYAECGQIGYLSRDDAERLAPRMDRGEHGSCWISQIQGGTRSKPSVGVVIEIHFDGDLSPANRRVEPAQPGLLQRFARMLLGGK